MRPPGQRNGAAPASANPVSNKITGPCQEAQNCRQDNPDHEPKVLPRATAFYSGPVGRRDLGLLVVTSCPGGCDEIHTHRTTGPHGGRRVGSCGTEYFVVLAGSKRSRWSR